LADLALEKGNTIAGDRNQFPTFVPSRVQHVDLVPAPLGVTQVDPQVFPPIWSLQFTLAP
jgi:hypothetical protein